MVYFLLFYIFAILFAFSPLLWVAAAAGCINMAKRKNEKELARLGKEKEKTTKQK